MPYNPAGDCCCPGSAQCCDPCGGLGPALSVVFSGISGNICGETAEPPGTGVMVTDVSGINATFTVPTAPAGGADGPWTLNLEGAGIGSTATFYPDSADCSGTPEADAGTVYGGEVSVTCLDGEMTVLLSIAWGADDADCYCAIQGTGLVGQAITLAYLGGSDVLSGGTATVESA